MVFQTKNKASKHLNFNTVLMMIANAMIILMINKAGQMYSQQQEIGVKMEVLKNEVSDLKSKMSQVAMKSEVDAETRRLELEIDRINDKIKK